MMTYKYYIYVIYAFSLEIDIEIKRSMTEHLLQFPPIMKRLVNIKLAPLFTADIYTLELSHTLTLSHSHTLTLSQLINSRRLFCLET